MQMKYIRNQQQGILYNLFLMSNIAEELVNNHKADIVYYRAFTSLSYIAKFTLIVQIIKAGTLAALIGINTNYFNGPYRDLIVCFIIDLVASCLGLIHYLILNFGVYCNVELFTYIAAVTNHAVASQTITDKSSIEKCVSETVFLAQQQRKQVDLAEQQRQTYIKVAKNMITSSIKQKKSIVAASQNIYELVSFASMIYTIVVLATTPMPAVDLALLSLYVVIVGLFTTFHLVIGAMLMVLLPVTCCMICLIACCCSCCFGKNTFSTKAIDVVERQATTVEIVNTQGSCSICQTTIALKQKVYVLPCSQKHIYHIECLRQWTRIKSTCPLCRAEIPMKGEESQQLPQDSNRQVVRASFEQEPADLSS